MCFALGLYKVHTGLALEKKFCLQELCLDHY